VQATIERLVDHGVALIDAEVARRRISLEYRSGTTPASHNQTKGAANLKPAAERS
jgi:hypothetical protein